MGIAGLIKLLIAVFGFGILVFFHEFGHFIMGRLFKMKVEKFSIGMGPAIFGFNWIGTYFQISAIPLGGFCKFKGDEITDDASIARDPDSFYGVHPAKRIMVALFGPFMNYLIAIIFLMILAMSPHEELLLPNKIMVADDLPSYNKNEPTQAKLGGLKSGDRIIQIDNKKISSFDEITRYINIPAFGDFLKTAYKNKKEPYKIKIDRNGEIKELIIQPKWDPETLRYILGIGIYIDPIVENRKQSKLNLTLGLKDKDRIVGIDSDTDNISAVKINDFIDSNISTNKKAFLKIKRDNKIIDIPVIFNEINNKVSKEELFITFQYKMHEIKAKNIFDAFVKGFNDSNDIIKISAIGLHSLVFKPKKNIKNQIGGPLRVGKIIGESTFEAFEEGTKSGLRAFFSIISLISLSLAFFNLLPIPALDGGHILFNIIELIRRKPISIKTMNIINTVFFLLLMLLMIFVIAFIDIPDFFKK